MEAIAVIEFQGRLVVDSRLVADELGIKHKNLIQTIRKYQTEIEYFDQLMFENATVTNSVGASNEQVFCYLNEEQATFVMTLSRNTANVIKCKQNLVSAFSQAKKGIKQSHTCPLAIENEQLKKASKAVIQERKPFFVYCDGKKYYMMAGKTKLFEQPLPDLTGLDLEETAIAINNALRSMEAICEAFNGLSKMLTPVVTR